MSSEKQQVALSSVIAAIFLTIIKVIVGVMTGSLGILSEAAHSILDLGAAIVTFFAVRISDKPADNDHNYGHGKIESFSALIETLLLLATCVWIIYEASKRLFFGELIKVDGTLWGIVIMLLSIMINISRARVLRKAAKKYGSQALEADALHFDSDVWSSLVVIGGLICVWVGDLFKIPFMNYGDPIAALGVSALVSVVSFQLGKRTIDVLLDTAPKGMVNEVLKEVNAVNGVLDVGTVRIRPSGAYLFLDISVGIAKDESHRVVHSIVHEIKSRLQNKIPKSDVVVSTFPVDTARGEDKEIYHTVKLIVDEFPVFTNIHNIHVYEVAGKKYIAIHIEVKESMSLNESHKLSHKISEMVQGAVSDVEEVSVNFEYVNRQYIAAEDITCQREDVIREINRLINVEPERLNCHDIKIYSMGDRLTLFLHCELDGDYTIDKIQMISEDISDKIKNRIKNIESIHVHLEPMHH
jgi:cation diffusion facilitator family transporter